VSAPAQRFALPRPENTLVPLRRPWDLPEIGKFAAAVAFEHAVSQPARRRPPPFLTILLSAKHRACQARVQRLAFVRWLLVGHDEAPTRSAIEAITRTIAGALETSRWDTGQNICIGA
jgi:hypothetical protein